MIPQQPISISEIKQLFHIPIYKIPPIYNYQCQYYQVVTSYGNMCLILEIYEKNEDRYVGEKFIKYRNNLVNKEYKAFPTIYEQHLVQKQSIMICLTLTQQSMRLGKCLKQNSVSLKPSKFAKLVQSVNILMKEQLCLQNKIEVDNLLYLINSQQVCIDFTDIQPSADKQNKEENFLFHNVVKCIIGLLSKKYSVKDKIDEIIFIKGHIYTFVPEKLSQAQDCTELLIFLNVCINLEVLLISKYAQPSENCQNGLSPTKSNNQSYSPTRSPTKKKLVLVKNLQGNPIIQIFDKEYSCFRFEEGKCINILKQIFYQELRIKFFRENALYKLQQLQHLIVHVSENYSQKSNKEIQITVYPPVSKPEFISFLLAYIKCIEPVLTSIKYYASENTLKITFWNKMKQQKCLNIVFYEEYVIKDEEISMILERSALQQCKLDLRSMQITDGLLVFLSHSEKTKEITQLYLSDQHGLTDLGLTTFLRSSFINNLTTLSLTSNNQENGLLTEESIEVISQKLSLKRLYLKKSTKTENKSNESINISNLSLIQLHSFGQMVPFESIIKGNLKILKLDQIISIQKLKYIKHLHLKQLKVRLHQNLNKSFLESFTGSLSSSFSGSSNKIEAVKKFAEGQSRKTLKVLDISYSNCKFSTFRPLLGMCELQKVLLEGCKNLGTEFQPISPKILSISLAKLQISLQQIIIILRNMSVLVQLNLTNARIIKHEIITLIKTNKLHINNLIVSEMQYTNKFLQLGSGDEDVDCIEIFVNRLLDAEQEYSLNHLIMKASQSKKTLRFKVSMEENNDQQQQGQIEGKKQLLIEKINKFLIVSQTNVQSLSNIYINKMKVSQLLEIQQDFQVEDSCQSMVASSIAIGANKCRIISLPKIIIRKNFSIPIYFRLLEKETINRFTHRFVKFMQTNQKYMTVDLSGNKLVGTPVINMLLQYGKNLIKELDFRNCIFTFNDIVENLFEFEGLNLVNDGEYSIYLNKENFASRSQKYLKLFMHSNKIKSLKIQCQEIEEVQILFSVLSHILDQCSAITSLYISFAQIVLNHECEHFISLVFKLSKLLNLEFILKQCQAGSKNYGQNLFKDINLLKNLQKLKFHLPSNIFPQISLTNLTQVCLQFTNDVASQGSVNKCIKNLQNTKNLKTFRLSLAYCTQISNVGKIFGLLPVGCLLQKWINLEHLNLNFQYCSLKEQPLYQFLNILPTCKNLKYLELNVSFAISNVSEFAGYVQKMIEDFCRPMCAKIICVTQNSRSLALRSQTMNQKGIQFIK